MAVQQRKRNVLEQCLLGTREGIVVALYGTLRRAQSNVRVIDELEAEANLWRDTKQRIVVLEDVCVSLLPGGGLPALYNLEGPSGGVAAELVVVDGVGYKALCRFEGAPGWYQPHPVICQLGDERVSVTVFMGPRGFDVGINVEGRVSAGDSLYDYTKRDQYKGFPAILRGVLAA